VQNLVLPKAADLSQTATGLFIPTASSMTSGLVLPGTSSRTASITLNGHSHSVPLLG